MNETQKQRLIDVDALLEAMPKDDVLLSCDVRKVILDAPIVDAVPLDFHNLCLEIGRAEIKKLEGQIDRMLDYMHGDCGACKHRNVHGLAGTTCGDCVMEWEHPNWECAGEADEKENNNV